MGTLSQVDAHRFGTGCCRLSPWFRTSPRQPHIQACSNRVSATCDEATDQHRGSERFGVSGFVRALTTIHSRPTRSSPAHLFASAMPFYGYFEAVYPLRHGFNHGALFGLIAVRCSSDPHGKKEVRHALCIQDRNHRPVRVGCAPLGRGGNIGRGWHRRRSWRRRLRSGWGCSWRSDRCQGRRSEHHHEGALPKVPARLLRPSSLRVALTCFVQLQRMETDLQPRRQRTRSAAVCRRYPLQGSALGLSLVL